MISARKLIDMICTEALEQEQIAKITDRLLEYSDNDLRSAKSRSRQDQAIIVANHVCYAYGTPEWRTTVDGFIDDERQSAQEYIDEYGLSCTVDDVEKAAMKIADAELTAVGERRHR